MPSDRLLAESTAGTGNGARSQRQQFVRTAS
jgi:hypothetical protein